MNWKQIWNRPRELSTGADVRLGLANLLELDGYGKGHSEILVDRYERRIHVMLSRLFELDRLSDLPSGLSVCDIACGAGATSWVLQDLLTKPKIVGLDFSKSLLAVAEQVLPDQSFQHVDLRVAEIPECDFAVCWGGLHYLDLNEAEVLVAKVLEACQVGLVICDIPSLEHRAEAEAYRASLIDDYVSKYEGLQHLYLSPKWFEERFSEERNIVISTEEYYLSSIGQERFRFDIALRKSTR